MSSAASILVVEDDEAIRNLVTFHLRLSGYEFVATGDGLEGLNLASTKRFDLLVLDVVLPGIDGISIAEALRRQSTPFARVPILMLTARGEESDRVLGLESGADDYLVKPFGVRELLARIKALLRRAGERTGAPNRADPVLVIHGVSIDPARRVVEVDGRPVQLTPQEFSLLYVLASHPGIVYSRDDLLSRVWTDGVFITERGVDTLVKRLRRKVERNPSRPTKILTAWGAGYKFSEP